MELCEFGLRIKDLMESKKIATQVDFAAVTGISFQTLSNYLSGKSQPKLDFLETVSLRFNVNGDWLLTGRGKMFLAPGEIKAAPKPALGPVTQRVDGIERAATGTPLIDLIPFVITNLKAWYGQEAKKLGQDAREPSAAVYAQEDDPLVTFNRDKPPDKSGKRTRD